MQPLSAAQEYGNGYLRDVLGLAEGMKEEAIDDRLAAEAKELGIAVDVGMKRQQQQQQQQEQRVLEENIDNRPLSMPVIPGRRSSVDSRRSVAASMMSTASSLRPQSNGLAASRASLSFRDYDNFLARGRPEGRGSMSFSPPRTPSASTSVFSLPLSSPESSPKKQYRLMRGLNMLKFNRMDSATFARGCPHCPRDALSQRRAVHKLPCGHRLCTKALRDTIMSATGDGTGSIPSCCGIPIPGRLVEHVMTQQEQSAVLDRLDQWSRAGSAAPSLKSEARASTTQRPHALSSASRSVSDESKVDSVAPESKRRDEVEESRPEMQKLRAEQAELEARFSGWIDEKRAELTKMHEGWRSELRIRHDAAVERLEEDHAHSMSEAEDKQVKAEADLRASHAQEERDSTTALRHMEAYCAGTYVSTGQPHGRNVAEQDLAELENARRSKEGMAARHESAINVLRGEQARRLRLREQRQEKAVLELRRAQRMEELGLERGWAEEGRVFGEFVLGRWEVLRGRWEVEGRLARRRGDLEQEARVADGGGSWRNGQAENGEAVGGAKR